MKYRFQFDENKCVNCGSCSVACMDQNDLFPEKGDIAYRRCYTIEDRENGCVRMRYLSTGCMHCDDAPCIDACSFGCFYKDEETGFTLYDNDGCVSCFQCQSACPYDAIVFPRDEKMEKCDGCAERVKHGLQPACVVACAFGALQLIKEE